MQRKDSNQKKKTSRRSHGHSGRSSGDRSLNVSGGNKSSRSLNASGHRRPHKSKSSKASMKNSAYASTTELLKQLEEAAEESHYDEIPFDLRKSAKSTTLKLKHDIERLEGLALDTPREKHNTASKELKKLRRRTVHALSMPDPGDRRAGTRKGPKIGTFIVSKEDKEVIERKLSDREKSLTDLSKAGRFPKQQKAPR